MRQGILPQEMLEAMADLAALQQTLGTTFNDTSLLEQACVHPSYLNEEPSFSLPSNERMAFLGDAVLELVVAESLFQSLPFSGEGEMSRLRDSLINGETLAAVATTVRLGEHLYVGKGEERAGGRERKTNLATALEAVIGALYLDQGFTAARDFVLSLLEERLTKALEGGVPADYKSRLQELTQARWGLVPKYRIVDASGPEHAKRFTVEVYIGDRLAGQGQGRSKRAGETEAARVALIGL